MKRRFKSVLSILAPSGIMLLVLPMLGVALSGRSPATYMEFPPRTRYIRHAGFSPVVFAAMAVCGFALCAPFVFRLISVMSGRGIRKGRARRFPWWGWAGVGICVVSWWIAWTRQDWAASFQAYTFSPIWFGFIIAVNGLSLRKTGKCLMLRRRGYFLRLFFLSAAFWWFFEYLNRFVQNWYYLGVRDLVAWEYFLYATLPFATVLPAVLSVNELLRSYLPLDKGFRRFITICFPAGRISSGVLVAACGAGLIMLPLAGDYLFPLLWVVPVLLIASVQGLAGQRTIFHRIRYGDWTEIVRLALAAVVCGFFWELWNTYSLAKWKYSIPFVGRYHLFEMPVLGYLGYLPFGLECGIIGDLLEQWMGLPRSVDGANSAQGRKVTPRFSGSIEKNEASDCATS